MTNIHISLLKLNIQEPGTAIVFYDFFEMQAQGDLFHTKKNIINHPTTSQSDFPAFNLQWGSAVIFKSQSVSPKKKEVPKKVKKSQIPSIYFFLDDEPVGTSNKVLFWNEGSSQILKSFSG